MSEDNKKHHIYGPSRWTGLFVCPGYTPRKDGDKEYADRGSAVHEALDTGDASKLREEDREVALWMRQEIAVLTQGLDSEESEVATVIPEDERIPEILWGITGTCDRTWTTENGTRHIADFKAFSKIGFADHKPQLVGYALGLPWPENDRWVFHILHGGSGQVETVEMDRFAVSEIAGTVAYAIEHPFEGRRRSDHCNYCVCAGNCPESARVVAFGCVAAGRITKDLVRENPAEAARLCEWMDMAAKRIDEAREIIKAVALEGVKIEDPASGVAYEIKMSAGRAEVPPLSEIAGRLVKEDGLTHEQIMERAGLSLTALRELVGKSRAEEYAVRGEDVAKFVRKSVKKALKGG